MKKFHIFFQGLIEISWSKRHVGGNMIAGPLENVIVIHHGCVERCKEQSIPLGYHSLDLYSGKWTA
jgi:hypothetical protein